MQNTLVISDEEDLRRLRLRADELERKMPGKINGEAARLQREHSDCLKAIAIRTLPKMRTAGAIEIE